MQIKETNFVTFPIPNDPHDSALVMRLLTPEEQLEIGSKHVKTTIRLSELGRGGEINPNMGVVQAEQMKIAIDQVVNFRDESGKVMESSREVVARCVNEIPGLVAIAMGFYEQLEEAEAKADKVLEKNELTAPDGSEKKATGA